MRTSEESTFEVLTRLRPEPVVDPDQTRIGLARLEREIAAESSEPESRRRPRRSRVRRLVPIGAVCALLAIPVVVFRGSPTAYADLTPLAERAERQKSLQPGPGEFYYRHIQLGGGEIEREQWLGPPGALATTLERKNADLTYISRSPLMGYTPWADLPTNPILLEAKLRARAKGGMNQDDAVWECSWLRPGGESGPGASRRPDQGAAPADQCHGARWHRFPGASGDDHQSDRDPRCFSRDADTPARPCLGSNA